MSILPKDIKLLWAKAAGLCSICKMPLYIEANNLPLRDTLIGAMCHIVGDKLNSGPRHKSHLTNEERDQYPNLILLCNNHHTEIDGNEQKYTIEELHKIKLDHEIWVQNTLKIKNCHELHYELYLSISMDIANNLELNRWDTLSETFIYVKMSLELFEKMGSMVNRLNRICWPGYLSELEDEFCNLSEKISNYINHFENITIQKHSNLLQENTRRYHNSDNSLFSIHENRYKEDYKLHFKNLWNLTYALTKFASTVRATVKPDFFFNQGIFIINDSLGTTNNMVPIIYRPNLYHSL